MAAAKTKITVNTEMGTFTRTTARTYSHLVAVSGYTLGYAAKHRAFTVDGLLSDRRFFTKMAAERRAGVAVSPYDPYRNHTAEQLEQLAVDAGEKLTRVQAQSIEEYRDGMAGAGVGALGWCGRLDLARKLASSDDMHETVRIFDVATGRAVGL